MGLVGYSANSRLLVLLGLTNLGCTGSIKPPNEKLPP
jgi:hypothetical protein